MHLKTDNSKVGTGTLNTHRHTPTPQVTDFWDGKHAVLFLVFFTDRSRRDHSGSSQHLFREFKNKKNMSFSAWWQRKAKSLEVC